MDLQRAPENSSDQASHWPVKPILIYGILGTGTLAERRYYRRSGTALALLVLIVVASYLLRPYVSKEIVRAFAALAPGAAFVYIAWEFRRYLCDMDELARRIHLESIAWTYLCGMCLAMLLGGLCAAYGWRAPNPGWFLILEPVRSAWLYFISRRYQ